MINNLRLNENISFQFFGLCKRFSLVIHQNQLKLKNSTKNCGINLVYPFQICGSRNLSSTIQAPPFCISFKFMKYIRNMLVMPPLFSGGKGILLVKKYFPRCGFNSRAAGVYPSVLENC